MAKIGITILGMKEVSKMLKDNAKEAMNRVDTGVTKAVFFVEGEVKQSISGNRDEHMSVDTGRFLNSVKGTKTKKMEGKVESNVKYGPILEHGSSSRTGRHHFGNTATRNTNKVKKIIAKEVNKI